MSNELCVHCGKDFGEHSFYKEYCFDNQHKQLETTFNPYKRPKMDNPIPVPTFKEPPTYAEVLKDFMCAVTKRGTQDVEKIVAQADLLTTAYFNQIISKDNGNG
jgi:hypothetical protein